MPTQRNPVKKKGDGCYCPGRFRNVTGGGAGASRWWFGASANASGSGRPSTKCPWRHGSHVMYSCVVAVRVRSCAALSRVRFQFTSGRGGRAGQPQPGRPPGMGQAAQGVPNVLDAVLAMGHGC